MKNLIKLASVAAMIAAFVFTNTFAQDSLQTKNQNGKTQKKGQTVEHGKKFVDANGDGYNDNAPDHDGDGIPNGLDDDYVGPNKGKNKFVDLDGDGINDNAGKGNGKGKAMKGSVKGNGKGNKGVGPRNGAASKAGNGTGVCDGTGQGNTGGKGNGKKGK